MSELHDPPTAQQLIESVREWLETDVFPQVEGRLQFHTRVAMNVLAMVERELELGEVQKRDAQVLGRDATRVHYFKCFCIRTGKIAQLHRVRFGSTEKIILRIFALWNKKRTS